MAALSCLHHIPMMITEDFIISNTPYPLIEFSAKKDLKNGKKKTATIKVSNLADNILIPISICGKN